MNTRTFFVLIVCVATLGAQGTITSLAPASVQVGGASFLMAVNGSGFTAANIVQWDGVNLTTQFASANQLAATVTASLITAAGSHGIRVRQSALVNNVSNTVTFNVNNPVPTITSFSPTSVLIGSSTTIVINGTHFGTASIAKLGGTNVTTVFSSSTQLQAFLPASMTTTTGPLAVEVFNPPPGGGTAAGGSVVVQPLVPALTSITPIVVLAGTAGTTLTANGSNYTASSVVQFDGSPLPTTFASAGQLSATVSAALLVSGGIHTITVVNPGAGGGTSAGLTLTVMNPAPVISSISASVIPGGGSDAALTLTGAQFVPSTTVDASGTPISWSFASSSQLSLSFPASLQRAIRTFTLRVTNPGPGGGSASIPFTVGGPAISSCAPAVVPVLIASSSPMTLTVNGGAFQAGDQIRINGLAQVTILVNSQTLHCTLTGSMAVLVQPGGFAVTVTRAGSFGLVSSNAFGVTVGIAGTPDNAGTVTLAPAPPVPGGGFNLRVELPVASGPVTLLAQVPAPPTVMLNIAPNFDLVVGPGLSSPIILADGLGIFGPATPTSVTPLDLSSFGIPGGHGLFEIRDLGAPAVPVGITFSLAAVYVAPSSPIGINATHVGGPFSL